MADDIKPRVDEETGDRLCCERCPAASFPDVSPGKCLCEVTNQMYSLDLICPVHARRVAQWAERALGPLGLCLAHHWPGGPMSEDEEALVDLLDDYPGEQGGGA